MEKSSVKYIIISPVRNEEKNIEKALQSVVSQTIKPSRWIIVNDGSTDKTAEIVMEYVQKYRWISLINLSNRGYYDLMCGGEIKAFYKGYEKILDCDFEFLAKLDGDISFDKWYFENLFKEFYLNRKLGIASGACNYYEGNRLILEKSYKKHVRGAARVYRKECWDEIGGVINDLGWDAIDVYKARMLGWDTYNFEHIRMIHHVKTWSKGGLIHGRMRAGRMAFLMGTHPLFFFLKVVQESFNTPLILSGCAFLGGYMMCFIKKERPVVGPDLMSYIRKEQMSRLKSVFIRNK